MSQSQGKQQGLLKQPKAVWAVAFACVISFMGIGLVDPILPAISDSLGASPAQVSLLFTSYLVVTAIAMLGVGWVSSRIGSKWALIVGLALIVVFAALAGAAGSVDGIIAFRGGWGLGNALFIATSLAVIVASAQGGFSGAIILYEAALGLGIAAGPLIGGLLGHISWRGPFFGVAVLMGIALVATLLFIPKTPKPAEKISLGAPLAALKHRGLLTMGIMALLYNWGFFTMLGYAPYPMKLDALQLGFVFTGWGLLVAAFAVFFAPRLQRRFGTAAVLYANLAGLGIVMTAIAIGVDSPPVVIAAVIISGAFIGINNTLTTQAVMLVSPVERSVASSAYGFLRFFGGGLAPFVAGIVAQHFGQGWAFGLGAIAFFIAIPVLASGHKLLVRAESAEEAEEEPELPGASLTVLDEVELGAKPIIAAIDDTELADQVVDRAVALAREHRASVEIVHVTETEVVADQTLDPESARHSRAVVDAQLDRVRGSDVVARGVLLTSVGDHAATGAVIARRAAELHAGMVVLGRSKNGPVARLFDADLVGEIERAEDCRVILVA
ncbi:MFS transporter [Gulosibacter sp. 10]|uniref:MFS transporter n=1 Tax=Gulosibacter sp. 10 TaxID=1255570 RepID=UPI00097E81C8|nr:MFS transporter [Gulosibacter sp. 10]SJM53680.1 multidrug-efflux transporter protein [Gulosibacter sp. 10]